MTPVPVKLNVVAFLLLQDFAIVIRLLHLARTHNHMSNPENFSPEFLKFACMLASVDGKILDAPCGRGRHAIYLAKRGASVLAVDKSNSALEILQERSSRLPLQGDVTTLKVDLLAQDLSLPGAPFSALVSVHFPSTEFVKTFFRLLSPNGLLYLETIGNFGDNYLELPVAGRLGSILKRHFSFVLYNERPAGPAYSKSVTVRLLAKRTC